MNTELHDVFCRKIESCILKRKKERKTFFIIICQMSYKKNFTSCNLFLNEKTSTQ